MGEKRKLDFYIYVSELAKLYAKDGKSPVAKYGECNIIFKSVPSNIESVKFYVNLLGPPRKTKYTL